MTDENAAVKVAKERKSEEREIQVLSTGVRVRLVPVGASLIRDATMHVKEPPVPVIMDDAKGREIENPTDPAYVEALDEARQKREMAGMDAMMLFGAELVDGLPEDDSWVRKLRYLEKRGELDLQEFDLEDELDLELLYKRYVVFGSMDLVKLAQMSGIGRQEVQAAINSFPGREERISD